MPYQNIINSMYVLLYANVVQFLNYQNGIYKTRSDFLFLHDSLQSDFSLTYHTRLLWGSNTGQEINLPCRVLRKLLGKGGKYEQLTLETYQQVFYDSSVVSWQAASWVRNKGPNARIGGGGASYAFKAS